MILRFLTTALIAILLIPRAQAQTYFGPGNVTCDKFLAWAEGNNPIANSIDYWLRGYLSGLNAGWKVMRGTDPLINVDSKEVTLYVIRYCEANLRKNILNATNDYFSSLPK